VDSSDSKYRCIGKMIARDLSLVASRLYRMAVTRPQSRVAVTSAWGVAAGIVHGDHWCAATEGEYGDCGQGKVEVQCLSDPGRACRDKAGGYGDVDTYALRIKQKVKDYNLCSEPSSYNVTRTVLKMTAKEHLFRLLHSIPSNDDWQFFLDSMMDKNATATLMPDDIVIK